MPRWIAFDQQTSSLLRSSLAQGTTVETFGRGPIDYALAKPGAVVTLLPAIGGPDVGIAVFRRPRGRDANVAPVPVGRVAPSLVNKAVPAPALHKPAVKHSPSSLPPRG